VSLTQQYPPLQERDNFQETLCFSYKRHQTAAISLYPHRRSRSVNIVTGKSVGCLRRLEVSSTRNMTKSDHHGQQRYGTIFRNNVGTRDGE